MKLRVSQWSCSDPAGCLTRVAPGPLPVGWVSGLTRSGVRLAVLAWFRLGLTEMGEGASGGSGCLIEVGLLGVLTLRRRLARDYETLPERSRTMIHWTTIDNRSRRLTRESTQTWRDEVINTVILAQAWMRCLLTRSRAEHERGALRQAPVPLWR